MKKQYLILFLVFWSVISGCQPKSDNGFAIYLLSQDIAATEILNLEIKALHLESEPVISSSDIISYDKLTHTIELTQEAYKQVQQIFPTPVKVNGIPFVVCVGAERIYTGALWTPLSSLSFDGVVIMQPFDSNKTTIQINLGYPGSDMFTGSDPRADPRILNSLAQDGKLLENP